MKRNKKYYITMSCIMFICLLILNIYNLLNINGYIILLITYVIFNNIWYFYNNSKSK